ncbi:MAG: HD domain-containing protein [Phycisphaerales bacterium JB040]
MTPDPLWANAASFAARAHASQRRKDGVTPYAAHPSRVALRIAAQFGCADEHCLAAAFLHDTIEDTATDYDDLLKHFGRDTADIVRAMSKNMLLEEADREADYDARLATSDWRARLVKLADSLDNLMDKGLDSEKARARCRRSLALAEKDRAAHPESDRACRIVERALSGGKP